MGTTLVTTLAGQAATVSWPTRTSTGRLVVFVHGGGLNYDFATADPAAATSSAAYTRIQELIEYLTFRGYCVVCANLLDTSLTALNQGDTFGNDVSTTQLANVITAAKALPNVSQGKYGLVGFSSACFTNANHIRRVGNSGIAGLLNFCPSFVMDLYRGSDAAHGGPSPQGIAYAALNAAHLQTAVSGFNAGTTVNDAKWAVVKGIYEPAVIAPTVTVPWGFWSHSNDPIAPPTQASTTLAALAALVPNGKGTWLDMGATDTGVNLGHNTLHVEPKTAHDFLETWSW